MTDDQWQMHKSFVSAAVEGYGTITVRVVVLETSGSPVPSDDVPADVAPDELLPEEGNRPASTFLEDPKRGRQCCVFLINGQRQHAWDNAFIVRDLGLKYLRNRMIVVVDVDGLRPEAIAELMQGSRQQFYEGKVYDALAARVIATLKDDPDLKRLEEEAEDEVSNLQAGDEAVKSQLDQLIEEHHDQATRIGEGHEEAGDESQQLATGGSILQPTSAVVPGDSTVGPLACGPLLMMRPDVGTVRLRPDQTRRLVLCARPEHCWTSLEQLSVILDPPIKELRAAHTRRAGGADLDMTFEEPEDFDEDEYPIEATLRVAATFKQYAEPRILERRVVVSRPRARPPRPKQALKEEPTFLRVTSREPVQIYPGGPDVHIKVRWDGQDGLVVGTPPLWTFSVQCESTGTEPSYFITTPVDGRFELLVQASPGLRPGDQLRFSINAHGPEGRTLTTGVAVVVVEHPTPRRVELKYPGGAQRRPPYQLYYVTRPEWEKETCWDGRWTGDDPGAFEPPSERSPLSIFINQDMDLLVSYRESLLARKLEESSIKQRVNRYTAHVAFHLYQIFLKQKECQAKAKVEPTVETPTDSQLRDEIRRVAITLLKLMAVSQ